MSDLPSQRGETWNDTEAIDRHRRMTPSERIALAVDATRAAMLFANSNRRSEERLQFVPDRIVAALNAADVAYVTIGGVAVAAHGVVRAIRNLDLVPEPSTANVERLVSTLYALGADRSLFDLSRPFLDRFTTIHGKVDVYNGVSDNRSYPELAVSAISVDVGGEPAPICSLSDLRTMKLAAGRPRDMIDVAELDELNGH
ncbi:nucleotidyltransferase [Solirubrobacter taibaiensis]|nr:nucleotidyltransferase [Solirubrobacter taibaiensis]